MKRNQLFWALGWVTMSSLAALQACGGDDDDAGTSGGGGGSGGKASGGSGGKASGGSGGKATGGSSGSAGKASGGSSGTGTSGAGGAPGGAGGEGGASGDRASVCADYCEAYYNATPGDDRGCSQFDSTNSYDSEDDCNDVCVASDWEIGQPNQAGDTINCRLWHATLASMGDADTHCGHASEDSTGICQ